MIKKKKIHKLLKENRILNVFGLSNYVTMIKNYFSLQRLYEKKQQQSTLRNTELKVPLWRNYYGKMTKKYYSYSIFNRLPIELKQITTYNELKRDLKTHLLNLEL